MAPTGDFTYRDLWAIVDTAPVGTQLGNVIRGYKRDDDWDLNTHLLGEAVYLLNIIRWQKTADGAKGKNPPKPIPRPWEKDKDKNIKRYKGHAITLEEAMRRSGK